MSTPGLGTPAAPGRRTARLGRRRLDLIVVLAVVLPLLTLLAAFGVNAQVGQPPSSGPRTTVLDRSTVICPSPLPGGKGADTRVASLSGATGKVTARLGNAQQQLDLRAHAPTQVQGASLPLVVTGRNDLATGLVAARFGTPLAAADCRPPAADQWFTGVGAGPRHDSTLELTNPDPGRALVDVVVSGIEGPITGSAADSLRGIAVGGGQTVTIDLAATVPRRYSLALHVTTIRGRVSASVTDSFDVLGGGSSGTDWLAAQSAPSSDNLMLGLPAASGQTTLVVANPGTSEGRATIRLVTPQSVFTPEGAQDIVVPPQTVARVSLSQLLKKAGTDVAERPIGVEVVSTVPLTAGLQLLVHGDLARAVPLPPLTAAGAAVLPGGREQLVLAGATGPGVVTASLWDARGRPLDDVRVAVTAGQGYSVDLPSAARLMRLTPARTPVSAGVLVTGDGLTEVPVRVPLTTGLVPQVRPGTP